MKKALFLFAVTAIFGMNGLHAQCGTDKHEARLLAVAFHADYCGACKAIQPAVGELKTKLDGQPVDFVKFDFTSSDTRAAAEKKAAELGIADIYEKNKATGFVLLVDAQTRKTVGKLTREHSAEDMYNTIQSNL